MQVRSKWFALPLVAVVLAGCGSDKLGPGEIELSDLQGTWNVTQAQYVADADQGKKYDLIKDQGATGTATVQSNGKFTINYVAGGFTRADSGTIQVTDNGLILNYFGQATQPVSNIEINGDKLTMTVEVVQFDFPNDDVNTPVSANVNYVWQKASGSNN